jgi:hypothetical protein
MKRYEWGRQDLRNSVEEAPTYILWTEFRVGLVGVIRVVGGLIRFTTVITIGQTPMILSLPFSLPLHPIDLPETTGNGSALEPNLPVTTPIDITDEHIHSRVLTPFRHCQHLFEVSGSCEQGEETPKCTAAERCAAHTIVLARPGDFDHGDATADVNEEVGVETVRGCYKGHGVCVAV